MSLSSLARAASLAALALAATTAGAQAIYPDKPIRIMVGASPGGGTDILARVLADKFSPVLKQPVTVENRPGASNTIAGELTARAPADGATLLLATNTAQAVAPHILKLKYDPLKDLTPIGLVAVMPNVLVVSANSPYKSVKELVAAMAAKPGGFKYASSGIGSTQHVGGEAFNLATGMKSIHVPYKGSSQAHIDIISGEVDMMFDSTSSAMGQIKAGKFRALAVSAPQRSPELPDVPTLAEQGIKGADVSTWYGLYVTAGTPRPAVDRLNAELVRTLKLADVQARIKALGGEPGALTGDPFAAMNRQEFDHCGQLVRDANIKAE
ncbi:tripartite-type tricarboxylate transporter receptor subunit TctC [Variovorax boronicumulans]|uniref:Bug family tripartite tricarboxylate transporter substrate binding protein n=1 Tax=Variovorax boronicumulans TaxID=436515 RepID=UPI0027862E42|nr:tripartite tricarboxylate transporter substrate binding protein [Variovorax boronicumulans]MDQ0069813.1 tripartite-type tricarboxylate transporter receptor subunit TctC [Variovorax boronicumulans]